jgi:8-oxo-dGTP pyrophosphatase MutT (NUDIX family)
MLGAVGSRPTSDTSVHTPRPRAPRASHLGQRVDWHNDPSAPEVNSIRPSAGAFVLDDPGRILLIRRNDTGNWTMPGGAMEPGESLTAAAVRETLEETGITIEVTGLVGIWTDPRHRIENTTNGEVRQECSIIYAGRYLAGEPTPSAENTHAEWVYPTIVPSLQMDRSQRVRIDWALNRNFPHLDPNP